MADGDRAVGIGPLVTAAILTGTGADTAEHAWKNIRFQIDRIGGVRIAVGNMLDVKGNIGLGRTGFLTGNIFCDDSLISRFAGFSVFSGIVKQSSRLLILILHG